MSWVAAPTSSETRPPYSSREKMSLPSASVPSRCPGDPIGRLELSTLPPTGDGTLPTSGHRKHAAISSDEQPGREVERERLPQPPATARGRGASRGRADRAGPARPAGPGARREPAGRH